MAWAALAEDCGLKRLLAKAELFMVNNASPAFWQSPAFNEHKLSSSCMLRMLQAVQPKIKSRTASSRQGALNTEVRHRHRFKFPDPFKFLFWKRCGQLLVAGMIYELVQAALRDGCQEDRKVDTERDTTFAFGLKR